MLKLVRDSEQAVRYSRDAIKPDVRLGLTVRMIVGRSHMDAIMLFSIEPSSVYRVWAIQDLQ